MDVPCSFAVLEGKDFTASRVKGKEELKMSFFLFLGRVAVTTSSGGLRGPVNKLNKSDFFYSFK